MRTDRARTWVPLSQSPQLEFEEVIIRGRAQLVFEAVEHSQETQHIIIHQLSGPVPEESDFYGCLHVGPDQYMEIRSSPYFFPANFQTYFSSLLVIPSRLQFHGSKISVKGALGGLRDLVVSGGSLSFEQHARSLTVSEYNHIKLDSLQIKNNGIVKVGDEMELFVLETTAMNLTSGSVLQGRKLLFKTEKLRIEGTAEVSVSGGGFDYNPRGILMIAS